MRFTQKQKAYGFEVTQKCSKPKEEPINAQKHARRPRSEKGRAKAILTLKIKER